MKTHWLHMNESTYDKRGPWESLCIYHPSLQKLTGIHLILFQILPRPRSLMGLLCEDWNLLWAMRGRSGISYNIHWTIFTQSHSWKIFCEMNVYRKGFREEREVGRAGGEGKISAGRNGKIASLLLGNTRKDGVSTSMSLLGRCNKVPKTERLHSRGLFVPSSGGGMLTGLISEASLLGFMTAVFSL